MKRRGFLKSLLGVAALAAHAKFGSLVPIAEPEVEEATTAIIDMCQTMSYSPDMLFAKGDLISVDGESMVVRQVYFHETGRRMVIERGMGSPMKRLRKTNAGYTDC